MKLNRILFFVALFVSLNSFANPFTFLFSRTNNEAFGTSSWINQQERILSSQASNIDERALRTSLVAYINARRAGLDDKQLLTVIDYSKPATEKRLWVFDLRTNRELYNTYVSHGKNSGGITSHSFSNRGGSLKSSIGVFVTAYPYFGKNGYSLRLKGLEHGFNDNAYSRAVVVHGAQYVNPDIIRQYGQIGRSWGCPAVSTDLARPIINTIKDNTVLVAYYPDQNWLTHSRFLAS